MKTADKILHKYFHHFNSERTLELVLKAMDEYAQQSIAEHDAMKHAECPQHFIVNGICQNCAYQREEGGEG